MYSCGVLNNDHIHHHSLSPPRSFLLGCLRGQRSSRITRHHRIISSCDPVNAPNPPPLRPASCDSLNSSRRFALGTRHACLVGENRACSVPHRRDTRVIPYGHTTMAMHQLSTPSSPPPSPHFPKQHPSHLICSAETMSPSLC